MHPEARAFGCAGAGVGPHRLTRMHMHVVPAVPALCAPPGTCRVPVEMVNATFQAGNCFEPATVDRGFLALKDNLYVQLGDVKKFNGAWTCSAYYNKIQVELDKPYSGVLNLQIWAGDKRQQSSSSFITLWLSPTTNHTSTGVVCQRGVSMLAEESAMYQCPQASNVRYFTIERYDPFYRDFLIVNELFIFIEGSMGAGGGRQAPRPAYTRQQRRLQLRILSVSATHANGHIPHAACHGPPL